MRRRKKLLNVLAFSGVLFVSCAPDVSGYKGDGSISPIRFILNPGVRVDLGSLDLSEPVDRTYCIEGLPAVSDQFYFVSLRVYDPGELRIKSDSPIRFGLPGELELEV